MSMKIKDRGGKLPREAGMYMKTNILSPAMPECY
jgi:hypothetical protein